MHDVLGISHNGDQSFEEHQHVVDNNRPAISFFQFGDNPLQSKSEADKSSEEKA